MRLLVLDQFSDLGGAQRCLLDLLPGIGARGWRVLVGLPGAGELFERVRALGFETERVDCGPYTSGGKSAGDVARFAADTPRLAWQIRRLAERVKADLVYINGPRLLPAAAMARLGRPVLFHSHSYLFPGIVRRLAGLSLRRMDAWVVGQCRFVADPWRSFVRPERISVIYVGVPGPEPAAPHHSNALLRVGCIGRIAPEKGQREFVAAAARIHRALPACRFVVYGAALFGEAGAARYEDAVRAAAAGLPVEFAGWVPDVYGAMAQLDLLLVPSAGHEATTRVILEAFAAGLPVIAFGVGGIPEVLANGVTGLLASSTEEMAQLAIGVLTGDRRRLLSVAQAARESWLQRFTLPRYQEQMLRVMEACVAHGIIPAVSLLPGALHL